MSTVIRPELSKKNRYWIEKHRYYELKHFCLQYPIWQEAYVRLDELSNNNEIADAFTEYEDPTAQCGIAKVYYSKRMEMVRRAAIEADSELDEYIFVGVTQGCTYEYLKMKYDIPCSRDIYYDRYRKFFYILNKVRE